jgi:hypothetical protein
VHDGDPGWIDYTLGLKVDPLLNLDPFTGGLYKEADVFFRASDIEANQFGVTGNYYRLIFFTVVNGPVNELIVERCVSVAGFSCEILSDQLGVAGIFGPDPMDVLITLTGAHIQVRVDGSELVDLIDPAPLSHGGIGVGAVWEAHARFDDVVVSAVPEPSTLGLICMGLLGIVGCHYSVPMRRRVFNCLIAIRNNIRVGNRRRNSCAGSVNS